MRSTINNSISTVAGIIRGQVVVAVVLRSCLSRTRSFYSPTPASMATAFAALKRAAKQAAKKASAAVLHQGPESLMLDSGRGWHPAGFLSGTVC